MQEAVEFAGLPGPDQQLPSAIRVRHGNQDGKQLYFYLNFSGEPQRFTWDSGCCDLLGADREEGEYIDILNALSSIYFAFLQQPDPPQ